MWYWVWCLVLFVVLGVVFGVMQVHVQRTYLIARPTTHTVSLTVTCTPTYTPTFTHTPAYTPPYPPTHIHPPTLAFSLRDGSPLINRNPLNVSKNENASVIFETPVNGLLNSTPGGNSSTQEERDASLKYVSTSVGFEQ